MYMMRSSSENKDREKLVSDRDLFRFALSYIKPHKKGITISIILVILASFIGLLPELMIKKIIDNDIPKNDKEGLLNSVTIMIIIYLVSWVIGFIYAYLIVKIGQTTIFNVRNDMYTKLLNQSQTYYDHNQSGRINSKLTNDVDTLSNFLSSSLVGLVASIFQLSGILIIMFYFDITLSLISFAVVPLLFLLAYVIRVPIRNISMKRRKTISDVTSNLAENISGAQVSKSFTREKVNLQEFTAANKENYDVSIRATSLFAIITPAIGLISALGTMLILGYAGYQNAVIGSNKYSPGTIAVFMAYLTRFFQPIITLSMFYSVYQSALASLERIYLFLHEDVTVEEIENPAKMKITNGSIRFENVDFAYKKDMPIFQNLNVTIEGGKTLALVGTTGAGKSSFVKLISRVYDIQNGSIEIDGQDVSSLSLHSLRKSIGLVPQEPRLFNTTILENLRYGNPEISNIDLKQKMSEIGFDEIIKSLPEGYETIVNEGGKRLSRGQRQLIAFGRALIKDPDILILDEATSNLDPIGELRIQKALKKILPNRTAIIVAHRLSTIRNADRILVLENGEIVQDGTHQFLVFEDGNYQKMYLKQVSEPMEDKELAAKILQKK
ncbi:MAG: putative ABC transporter ATP-binding protein [Candidatus Heimdallarchaeota archaeon LC_2]|nr:MAG: putative ABC transporter ATP-binding protein [Candidatus Heimdallarchaeota archaeon LC_2]